MAYAILGTPKPAFFDSSGSPLASGTVTIQDPDDDSAKDTYPTAGDADASTNGVSTAYTLDSRGEIATQLWGRDGEDYKVILKDSAGSTVYTLDEIRLPPVSRRAKTTLGSSDATPNIEEGTYFQLNADNTTITNFDGGEESDIAVIRGPASGVTRIIGDDAIALKDGGDWMMQAGDMLVLLRDSLAWREIARTAFTRNTTKVKTGDESLTSSTLAADTHLINFELAPGQYYKVTGYLKVNADAAARDLEIDFVVDNAFQEECYTWSTQDGAGPAIDGESGTIPLTTAIAVIDIDGTDLVGISINGFCQGHATLASNVDVHFANQAGAGTVTVHEGSWVSFEQIR